MNDLITLLYFLSRTELAPFGPFGTPTMRGVRSEKYDDPCPNPLGKSSSPTLFRFGAGRPSRFLSIRLSESGITPFCFVAIAWSNHVYFALMLFPFDPTPSSWIS